MVGEEEVSFAQYLSIRSSYGPSFDSTGRRIAFLMDITGVPQVWSADVEGGWPNQLTFFNERVSMVSWSPKGDRLIFAMDQGGSERYQLYLIDNDFGGRVVSLTNSPDVMHIFGGWSPDGHSIAFASNERNRTYFDIYVQEVPGGQSRLVFQQDGANNVLAWSKDSRYLIISRDITSRYNSLTLLDVISGEARQLTPESDLSAYGSVCWNATGQGIYMVTNRDREFQAVSWMDIASGEITTIASSTWDIEGASLSPDGRYLVYIVNDAGYSHAFIRDINQQTGLRVKGLPRGTLQNPRGSTSVAWSPDSKRVAFTVNGATCNPNIWIYNIESETTAPFTYSGTGGIQKDNFVEPRLVEFPTFDGIKIPAFLYTPEGAEPKGTQKVIIHVHGGPEGQERPSFNPIYQFFVQLGYCVLAPNVRGSSGYGRTYIHLDDVRKRMDSVRDLKCAWRWLVDSGWADYKRVAVMGGSYGGFMTLAAITSYPELWAAAVELYGIANFVSFLENTSSYRRLLRESEYGTLQDDGAFLREISPIHYVDRIKAPLLVLHGKMDPRVPISETDKIVQALQNQGKAVEYVRFEGEGHGFIKSHNRVAAYSRIAKFLDKYV